jgi:serpin B
MKQIMVSLAAAAVLVGAGCDAPALDGGTATAPKSEAEKAAAREQATVSLKQGDGSKAVAATNDFGFSLLRAVAGEGNTFVSPTSVALALGMTMNGAEGETLNAMLKSLGHKGNLQQANDGYRHLSGLLQSQDSRSQLLVANSLWARMGVTFKQDFLTRAQQVFGADVRNVDFTSPTAPTEINRWVAEKTNGKIDSIIDQIPENAALYLVNAIYFHGQWKSPFDPKLTQPGDFRISGDKAVKAQMMSQLTSTTYVSNEDVIGASLPYGDERLVMDVLVPAEGKSLDHLLSRLSSERFLAWMASGKRIEVSLTMPKFRVEWKAQLKAPLIQMGMGLAFDPDKAQFGGMKQDARLFIQSVIHKTYVEVNEQGTEAAGATGVEVGVTSVPERVTLRLDRPFVYIIRDTQTGVVLFAGVLTNPS